MAESSYRYLPWVRQGIAGAIETADTRDPTMASRVKLDAAVHLNQGDPVTMTVRLYGPGDVTGFDAREVVRTDPVHLTPDFEPNYFPLVEFDRPDFPWLFTPAKANGKDQLRPWICLVAVEKDEDAQQIEINPLYPLPILHVADAQQELPDLSESWAWAHTEVAGASSSEVNTIVAANTEQVISRLLCPRKLKSNTTYYACVVPTFQVGRKAGLGEAIHDGQNQDGTAQEDATLKPAWDSTTKEIRLPVYYHWEFSTGAAGDFEALVWLLERQGLPSEVGARPILVRAPGGGLPDITEGLWLEGALRPERRATSAEPVDPHTFQTQLSDFQKKLAKLLNATETPSDLVLPPPIYGRWHAAQTKVSEEATRTPPWLHELNLDPRLRVAAALGTRVVQEQQEQLMAAAWEQVGEIERANQLLRQAQLARAAGIALYRGHLSPMSAESLLAVTAPVHARVRAGEGETTTVAATVAKSLLPAAALSAPFRRITRARGPLARRLEVGQRYWTGTLVERLNREEDGQIRVTPEPHPPAGLVTMDEVFPAAEAQALAELSQLDAIAPSERTPEQQERLNLLLELRQRLNQYKEMSGPQKLCEVTSGALRAVRLPPDQDPRHGLFAAFQRAAKDHQAHALPCSPPLPPKKEPLNLGALKETLLARLDPNVTIAARWQGRVQAPRWKAEDPLEPIMAAPEFRTPMYQPLAELSQDLLLPGLEHVPPNTIALLASNPAFIEAYMVGLNHEMSRELLWRGFPTDQRGTYFRHFWDPRSRVAPLTTGVKDDPPIHEWTGGLGDHMGGGDGDKPVLLIRGDLLRRYPRAVIYAARAAWAPYTDEQNNVRYRRELAPLELDAGYPTNEKYPIFLGTLAPDITFLGFELTPEDARGEEPGADRDAGWFIVLQQPPTEPRYGLDADPANSAPADWTWRDLSWAHVQTTAGGYAKLADGTIGGFPSVNEPSGLVWNEQATSAQIAAITLQQPFRAAIHASDLLPPKEP